MPQPKKDLPRYQRHSSGRARIVWTDSAGQRREKLLPGAYGSAESKEAFARLQLELTVRPSAPLRAVDPGPSVASVLLPYLEFAEGYYTAGSEFKTIKDAVKVVQALYGLTPAAGFGPLALEACREAMVRKGWSRQYANRQTNRIVRVFKWAASKQLVPTDIYAALKTLAPLRAGKTAARESEARTPADPAAVAATLPHLQPHARALVELLRVTGMRPAEACGMTFGQVDRTAAVWLYAPRHHKTAHKGKGRVVALGETAKAVIVAHLGGKVPGPDEFLFSPARQREQIDAAKRARRKSKVQPSQVSRKKAKPARAPGERFTPEALCHAVRRACKKAKVAPWSPYQLRHLVGAELREKFSLEHVRAALGHSHASMSAHYAKGADLKLAAEVAERAG